MVKKKYSLVTTTINVPHLLSEYVKDAIRFKRDIEQFIVVGDKKTPSDAVTFCKRLEDELGIKCIFLSVEDQEKYLNRWHEFKNFLPWNCIQRRDVGLVYAFYEGSADIVITIDDDNLLSQQDYFGHHDIVGNRQNLKIVSADSGWWNVCEMLEEARGIPFYHRGYPYSKRWMTDEDKKSIKEVSGRVVVNAGLWLDDPDVDALTRLYFPVRAIKPSPFFEDKLACDIGTWSPFNSQNTAILREAIPAYFIFPHVGRYDDIWASFVFRYISDFVGDFVTYGSPIVCQRRNPHDYLKDFDAERFGVEFTDIFIEALKNCKLTSKDYRSAFAEVAEQFHNNIKIACSKRNVELDKFKKIVEGFHVWAGVFK